MATVLGVDVGGRKKGFHVSVVRSGASEFEFVDGLLTVEGVVGVARRYGVDVIAIDCPPQAQIAGERTRLSERQLHLMGVRVQWTRRVGLELPEWMVHGQELWEALRNEVPEAKLIETFPTVVARDLVGCSLRFPIFFLQGNTAYRAGTKDLLDACLCAWAGLKYSEGRAGSVGFDEATGETDELGPIYF